MALGVSVYHRPQECRRPEWVWEQQQPESYSNKLPVLLPPGDHEEPAHESACLGPGTDAAARTDLLRRVSDTADGEEGRKGYGRAH